MDNIGYNTWRQVKQKKGSNMSDTQVNEGTAVPMDKVLEKLKNRIADQIVQIAMLEAYIDQLQDDKVREVAREKFNVVKKLEEDD